MPIDTYLFEQYVEANRYNRLLAEQEIIKDANRYLSRATIGLLLKEDSIDCLLTWNLLSSVLKTVF